MLICGQTVSCKKVESNRVLHSEFMVFIESMEGLARTDIISALVRSCSQLPWNLLHRAPTMKYIKLFMVTNTIKTIVPVQRPLAFLPRELAVPSGFSQRSR